MADVRQLKIDIMADAKNFIKSFEGALQKIEKTADNIDFLDGLTKDADKIKALIEEINLHSLDADAIEVTQKIDLINNALNSIKNTVKTLDFRINGLEDFLSTEGQISHLMDEVNGLANAYKNLAKASEAFSKREFDLYNIGDTKDLERQFRRALELYEEFNEASKKNKSGNYSSEYKQTAEDLYKYIALIRRVDELTKKANGKSYLQNVQVLDRGNIVEEATSIMSDVEKIIGEKATKINSSFSKMASNNIPFLNAKAVKKMQTEVTNYTLKNGSVIVPVKLKDGVYSEIEKQVSQIIGQLNQKGIDNPVTIQLKIDEEKLTKITDTIKTKIMAIQKDLTDATKGVIQETGISQQIKSMNLTNDTIPTLISKINTVNAELELMQDDLQKVSAELDATSQKAKDSIKVNTNSKAFKEYISEIKEVAKVLTELNNKFGDKGIKLNIEETSLERVNTQLSEMYQLLQRTNGLVDNSRLSLAFKNLKTQLNDLFDSKKIARTAKGAISETKKNVEELDNFFKEFIERYKKQGGNFNVADLVSNDIDKQKLSKLYEDFLSRNEGMRKIVEDAQNKKMTEIPITVDGQGLKAKIRQELKSEKFVIDVTPNINATNFTGKIESALDNKQVEVNVTPKAKIKPIANTRIRAEEKKEEKPLDKSKVVYHWGKLGSSTQPSHTFGQESKVRNGGTGTYVVSDLSSYANVNTNITKFNSTDKGKKFFAIDTSALKLFKPESQEAADAFQKFLHQLDQFILNTTKLFPQFEKDLEGVSEQTLFDSAKKIFPEFKMDFEQFSSWITSMGHIAKLGIQDSGGRANIRTDRIKQEYGVDDFKTRFLKQLGYQGYDLSNTSYNNLEHGSLLFDNAAREASVASAESIEELEKILLQKFKASVGNVGREAKKAVIDSTPATTNVAADTGTKITNKTDAVITPQIQTEEIISTQEVQNLATLEATILRIKNALKEKTGAIVAEDSQFQSEITNLSNLETKVKGIKENLAEISKIELSNIKNNLQNTEQNNTDKNKNVVEDIKPNQQSQQSQQSKETKTTASLDLTNVKEDIEEQAKDIKIPVKIVPDTKELKSSIQSNLDNQKFNIKIDGRIKNGELRIAAPVQKTEQNKEAEQKVLITPKMDGFVEKIQSNLNNKSVNIKVNPIVDDDFKIKIGDLVKGNVVENKENSQNDNLDNNSKNNKDNRKKATKSSKPKEKLKEEGSFLKEPDKKTSMSKDSKSSASLKANSDKVLSKAEQELEDWLANSVQDFLGILEVHKNGRVAKGQGELLYKFKKEIFEPYKQSGGQKELQDLFPNNKNIQKMIKGARPSNPNGSNKNNDKTNFKNNLNELAKKTKEVEKEQEKKPKYTQEEIEEKMDEYVKGFLNQIEFNNNKSVKKGQDKKFENFLNGKFKMYQNEGGDQHGQRTLEELFGDNKNVLNTFKRIIDKQKNKEESKSKEEQKIIENSTKNFLAPLLEQAKKDEQKQDSEIAKGQEKEIPQEAENIANNLSTVLSNESKENEQNPFDRYVEQYVQLLKEIEKAVETTVSVVSEGNFEEAEEALQRYDVLTKEALQYFDVFQKYKETEKGKKYVETLENKYGLKNNKKSLLTAKSSLTDVLNGTKGNFEKGINPLFNAFDEITGIVLDGKEGDIEQIIDNTIQQLLSTLNIDKEQTSLSGIQKRMINDFVSYPYLAYAKKGKRSLKDLFPQKIIQKEAESAYQNKTAEIEDNKKWTVQLLKAVEEKEKEEKKEREKNKKYLTIDEDIEQIFKEVFNSDAVLTQDNNEYFETIKNVLKQYQQYKKIGGQLSLKNLLDKYPIFTPSFLGTSELMEELGITEFKTIDNTDNTFKTSQKSKYTQEEIEEKMDEYVKDFLNQIELNNNKSVKKGQDKKFENFLDKYFKMYQNEGGDQHGQRSIEELFGSNKNVLKTFQRIINTRNKEMTKKKEEQKKDQGNILAPLLEQAEKNQEQLKNAQEGQQNEEEKMDKEIEHYFQLLVSEANKVLEDTSMEYTETGEMTKAQLNYEIAKKNFLRHYREYRENNGKKRMKDLLEKHYLEDDELESYDDFYEKLKATGIEKYSTKDSSGNKNKQEQIEEKKDKLVKNFFAPLLEQTEKKEQKQNTEETVEQQQLKEQINKAESKKQEKEKNKTDIEEEFDKYFQLASKSLAELYSSISFENVGEIDELTKQYGKVTNDLAKYFHEYKKKGGKKTVKDLLNLMTSQGLDSGELEDQITSLDLYANAEKSLKSNMEKIENKQPKYTQEEIEEKMDEYVQSFLRKIEFNKNKSVKKGQDKKFENFLDKQFKMYQNEGGDQHGQRNIEELFGDNKNVLNIFKRIIDARGEKTKDAKNQINEAIKNLLQQLKINKNGTVKAGQDEIIEKFLKEDYQKYLDSGGQKDIRSLLKKNGANKFIRNKFGKALNKMNSEEESKYNLEPIYEQNNLTLEQAIERKEQLTQRLLECSKLMQTATEEERQALIAETREIGKELFNLSANNLLPQNDFIRQMGTGVNTTPVDTLTTEMMKGQVSSKFTSEEASKAITEEAKANESLKQSAQDASKAIKDNTNSIEANKQRNEKEIVKQQGWRFGLVPKEFYESAEGDYAKKKEEYLREKVKQSFLAHEYFEQFNFRDDTEHIYDKGKLEYKTQGWNFDKNFNVESGFITYLEEEQQRVFTDYYRWLHYSEEEVENLRDYLSRFGLTLEGAISEGIVLERMVKDAETEEVKKSYSIFGVGRHQVKDNSSANLKTSEAFSKKIAKEQSSLDKWISNFNSKSLGKFENTQQMQELGQLTITAENYDAVIEKIAVLKNELETLYGTVSQYGKVGKSSLNPMVDMLTAVDKSEYQINKFAENYSKISISSEEAQTSLSTLANLLFLIQEAQSQLDTDTTGEKLVNLSKYMAQFRLESIKMTEELSRLNRINKDANGKGFKKLIEDMSLMPNPNSPDFDIEELPLINQYVDSYEFLSAKVIEINRLMNQLPNMQYGSEEYQKQIVLIKQMIKDAGTLQRELNSGKFAIKNEFGTIVKGADTKDKVFSYQEARQSIDDILSNYKVVDKIKSTSKLTESGDEIVRFTTQIQNSKGEIESLAFTYDSAMGTIRQATLKVEQPISLLESMFNRVSAKWKEVAAFIMTHMSFYRVISELKQGFSIIRQFDDALTEMQKVSNETITTLRDFQKTSFDLADSVGSDALTIQNSTAEWMRLGESLEDAQKSAQTAAILFNVSEFESINEATQSLVAMSAAYEDADMGLDKMDIVDKLNKVGNDFSISTDGLATALQSSASALTTTGATIDEAIALITAGNAVTQDPNKVGTGLRTIALRLTGTEASRQELEENGEEVEGMITNVSKLRDTILQATKVEANDFKGFDILNDVGAYKSPYEIMLGLADIYKDIEEQDKKTGNKQANLLLETIAGKTRANIAASILQNPDILRQAYAESENSTGSALEENAKYMESISGHIQAIKNEWQQIWANSANRDLINFFLDLAKAILEVVENIGLLGTALTVGTGISSLKWLVTGKGSVAGIIGLLGDLAKKEREVNGIKKAGKFVSNGFTSVESIEDVLEGTGKFTSNGFTSVKNIEDAIEGTGKFVSNGFTSVENIGDVVEDTSEGLRDLGNSAENLGGKAGVVGRLGELASNIGTLLPYIIGLVAAIAGAIIAFQTFKKISDKMNLSLEETREEAKTLVDNYRSERKNTSTHKQKIDEVSDRYEELSRGVNLANNQNLALTNEEYSEYLSICNDIAEMYPRLVSGYDAQGNAILKLKGNVEQLTEAYKQEQVESARTLLQGGENKEDAKSIWDNFVHQREGTWMQKHAAAGMYADEEVEYLDSLINTYLNNTEDAQKQVEDAFNTYFKNRENHTGNKNDTNRFNLLKKLGFSQNMSAVEFEDAMNSAKTELQDVKLQIEENEQFVREMIQARAEVNETYQNMTEDDQQMINSIFGNISKEKLYEYTPDDSGYAKITQDVNSTIETVNQALNSNESVFDEQWQNILNQDGLDYAIDNYDNSLNKLEELGYKQKDIIDLINQDTVKVGNVNLNADRSINWGEDPTKNENFANLRTWYDDMSAEELAREFKNATSTVLGLSKTYNEDNGEPITLSFAMITEDGKVLNSKEVDNYINNIIDTANKNNEPITIDTILKYDSDVKNGGMNIIADEGTAAADAMHEIEVLKGFGNIEGAYKTLDNLAQKTGKSIDDFITEYYKLGNLKGINTFRDVYTDMLGLGSGRGNLANAKSMGEFEEIANTYRQIFIDQMGEDTGAEIFDSIFDDQGRGDLTKRFDSILRRNWRLNPNNPEYQKYMGQFKGMNYDQAQAYTNAFSRITKLDEGQINQEYTKNLRDVAAGTYQATLNIEEETAAINSLNSAMASSNGATGMSAEEVANIETLYKDLAGYDASELFESTANGIHLNQKELRRLNKEYQKSKVKQQSKQYDELQKRLAESRAELDRLSKEYLKTNDASTLDKINEENRRKEGIEENINALEREIAQYSALTSAYNQYVNAQSSANENAKYENIQTGYDTAKDLIERGWGGQDDVRAYVNMFTQKDMMTAPVDEVIARFNELDDKIANTGYSMKDFFTVDENGKSTSTGVFNFLDVVKAKFKETAQASEDYKDFTTEEINSIADQLVTVTDDGRYSFDFNVLGGDQKVADMLGVDISLLQAIVQAAQDAGFEIQMSNALPGMDAVIQHVGEMKQELVDLGVEADKIKEYDFTLELGTIDANTELDEDEKIEQYVDLAKKIQEAKESVKLDEDLSPEQQAAGLEYLNAQLDATIQKAAQAKMQMTFGNLDISSWQADYQVLGTLMQDYYEKSSELAIKKEVGLDCSDATKSCDEARDALAEYLAEAFTAKELGEMGFELPVNFETESPEDKIKLLKEQLEKEDFELKINPTITDPTGDPTQGLDNQHIVIDVQFTMDGKTVVIEDINAVNETADEASRPREVTIGSNAKVTTEEIQETNKELDETDSKSPNVTIKTNAPKVSGDVSTVNRNLNNTSGTRTANIVVNGLNNAVTATGKLLNNFGKLANKTVTSTINTVRNTFTNVFSNKKPPFNGTAHADGTISKFAQKNAYVNGTYSGDWGVPQDEDALVNELGEEIIIHDGKWRIANNGNMGFTHLRKGDVVLNHKQTEELLKNGYVSNSRAKLVGGMSHVDGTIGDAFSKGTTKTNGVKRTTPKKTSSGKTNSNSGKKSGGNNNSNKKSSNNNNNNNTAETFDWVEVKIQRIEEAIAQLDSIIDSVYNTWDTRNNNLNKDLVKVGEEIDLQKRAIETYNNYLNKIGLSQTYINKIKKGELRIEDIKDDKLKEKIQKYQEYYNKVVQCQTSITELKEREKELVAQRFDNYQTWYEERLQDLDFRIEMMETLSDQAEKSGRLMSGYYAGIMRDTEEARINVLKREYNQLVLELEQATNSNTIAKWSEQWYEMCASIDEVSQAIAEAENNIIEYQNTIREYEWERFDKTLDRIGQIADETEWLNELLEEGKSFEEETGEYTKLGSARMGLLAIQYDTYLNESARYAAELKNIEKDITQDPYNQDLLDRRNELLEAQRDAISNALKERDAIKSLIEEGIEAQLNALQKLIDKYKEALQSQKDLYDYQNNVTESADEISRLQKLISAYQGDDSEESRLKVQQYQKELKDAQKSLYDTQYDRNISDTEEALDKLYEQYEETLNKALDDVDKLIGDVIKGVNLGSQNIVDTIKEAADKYGYTLTDSMSTIVSSINKLVSEDIKKNISSSDTGHNNTPNSGVDTASNNIAQNVNSAVQGSFNKAKEEYESGKATSIIRKNFLSNDRKSYTDAEGRTIQFTKAVAKGKDDFVNDTKGNQYYFDEVAGNLVGYGGGLQTIHGYKYYTDGKDNKGALQTGWQQVGDKWYYFYKSTMKQYKDHYKGVAATGWQDIDGETYYFDKSGVMQTGRWKDRKIGDKKYYRYWLKDNGKAFKNTSVKMGKTTYYFDKNGYLLDKKGGKPKVFTSAQYKTGVYGLTQDQLAWTQENKKEEAIIRPSDGAILTPLSHGDSVLNAKATKALFEFANNPDEYFKSYTDGSNYNDVPTINNTMNGDMNIQFNINGANITDYDTFKKQLTSDPQFERLLRSMTTDRLFGGSSLKKYKI